jgi:hypothetical protein
VTVRRTIKVNDYMPLMSWGLGEGLVVVCGLVSCANVLLLLKVTVIFVFLNRLVIFLTCGEESVKVVPFCVLYGGCEGGVVGFFCILLVNFVRRWM